MASATTYWRRVRPDLAPSALDGVVGVVVSAATPADAGELFTLQRAAFVGEGQINGALDIPPLTQTLDEVAASLRFATAQVARARRQGAQAPQRGTQQPEADPWSTGGAF